MTDETTQMETAAGVNPDGNDFLCLENVSKSYQEGDQVREVLRDTTISIPRGASIAILGMSGSGKTTLLNLVSGIDQPDRGRLWMNGIDLTALSDHERTLFRRRHTGFIFQFFNLIPTLTVMENVLLPLELNEVPAPQARQRALNLLTEVGLADRLNTFPDRLSGGEQQRVAIARALSHNPDLVLADEPTGNLDDDTGRQVMEMLDRLTRKAGKNLILVTHSVEAATYADRVYYLHDGRLGDPPA